MGFLQEAILKAREAGVLGLSPAGGRTEKQDRQAELERLSLSGIQDAQAVLSQMRQEGQLLLPALFEALGLEAQFDEAGNLTAVGPGVSQDILGARRERLLGALTEGFVDPALERAIAKSGGILDESLRRQLGPGFETSTAGIQSLQEQRLIDEILRFQTVQDEISRGTRDVLGLGEAQRAGVSGLPFRNLPLAAGFGDLSGASLGPLQFLLNQQQLAINRELAGAQIAESQKKSGGGIGGALGSLAGIILGSAAGPIGSAAGGAIGSKLGGLISGS